MNHSMLEQLTQILWPHGDNLHSDQVYWLLDGARDPEISRLVRFGKLEYTCLFSGELHPDLQAAAPYLVHLSAGSPTTNRLLSQGWGNAWGVLVVAPPTVGINALRMHFKKLLRVQTEDGRVLMFRFYDPRVLAVYLPTCTQEELGVVFGPVLRLVLEEQEGDGIRQFDVQGGEFGAGYRLQPAME